MAPRLKRFSVEKARMFRQHRLRVWQLALAGALALMPAPVRAQLAPPGQGVVRALVIGADHYVSHRSLRGAVADARDLEQALRKGGVAELTMLVEEQASRRNAEAAMDRLVSASGPGDLVVITFAGHGSQSPERIKGS